VATGSYVCTQYSDVCDHAGTCLPYVHSREDTKHCLIQVSYNLDRDIIDTDIAVKDFKYVFT